MTLLNSALSEIGIDSRTARLLTGSHAVADSMVSVQVEGGAALEQALNQLPEKIAKKVLVAAVRAGAKVFQEKAMELAPSDPEVPLGHPDWRTLHLHDGITLRVRTVSQGASGSEVAGTVGLDGKHVFFGKFVEFGHITASGHGQVAPHPFMRPAFESAKESALRTFREKLQSGITRETAK